MTTTPMPPGSARPGHPFDVLLAADAWDGFHLLFRDHPQPMWIYELDSLHFLAVNGAAIKTYGYSESEFLSMTIDGIAAPADRAACPVPRSVPVLSQHQCKDARLLDVELTSHVITFGRKPCCLVLIHDVSDTLRVERALYFCSGRGARQGLPLVAGHRHDAAGARNAAHGNARGQRGDGGTAQLPP